MITIVFGQPRVGKTAFITSIANDYIYDLDRKQAMRSEVFKYLSMGYEELTIPIHPVFANYTITSRKFGYSRLNSYWVNPYTLGFKNEYVKTSFIPPYSVIFINEAQKFFNSRMSLYFPDWQSRFMEMHGHFKLDIYLDVQRPMLIDVNIRELAQFIEIVKMDKFYNQYGKINKCIWTYRHFESSSSLERYFASGKKDTSTYTELKREIHYNVFDLYYSFSAEPKFLEGHENHDFTLIESFQPQNSFEGFNEFLKQLDDELPENFYIKRSERKNGIQKE